MNILLTIVPIFVVMGIGWLARRKEVIPAGFLAPANRLVYQLAIPAMIFRAISGGSLKTDFHPEVVGITLAAIFLLTGLGWTAGRLARVPRQQFATFLQSSFHGNLGYIGLAVGYYFLGDAGLAGAGIIAGFMMILQNVLAVILLQVYGNAPPERGRFRDITGRLAGNPVIVSALAGMLWSVSGLPMPLILGRSLDILSSMALPLALLLIGASLSFDLVRSRLAPVLFSSLLKLVMLPAIGILLYQFRDLPSRVYLPGLILLASPTATIAYVMAREMNGDTELAAAAISVSTLLSAATFSVWLTLTQ